MQLIYGTVWEPRHFQPFGNFAEGLFFSNILQILIFRYCFNIEELTDLI
jgi:hypothetical protein